MPSEVEKPSRGEPAFRLRIVNADYYMSEPLETLDDLYSQFRQNEIKRVAVLRIFGTSDSGAKTCLHVHRVYPHLSIRFNAKLDDNYEYNKQEFMRRLVDQLESRLLPTRVRTRNTTKDSPIDQLIYNIEEVDAMSFYGFHDKHQKFLRIYFYNPLTVQKAAEQLLSGDIMDRQMQPFEAHIPYTLQFFIANNLYGMNFLDAKRVVYRKTNSLDSSIGCSDVEPQSSCQIECDIDFKDILNRYQDMENRRIPGLEAIWRERLNCCRNSQEVVNLKGVPSQERPDIPMNNMELYHMEKLYEGLAQLDLKLEGSQSVVESSQSPSGADHSETNFANMIVDCITDNDPISQTIEDVINNSKTLSINQTIEDVITNSQKSSIVSQTIEDVVNESQKQQKNRTKRNTRRGETSRRKLTYNSSTDEESDESTEIEDNEMSDTSLPLYVDAGTQTENKNTLKSIDSLFGFEQDIEDVICDCDSDECCDQCCDQVADQCECDCDKCEFEKCKRIPQLDGAFDSDDSGSNFSPDYKDDTGDSDFEVGSKRSRSAPKKGGRKRPVRSRASPNKRKKTTITRASDKSDVESVHSYGVSRTTPKRKSTARVASPKFSANSGDEDVFESSSGRKVKSSKNLSSRLWDQFKPSGASKTRKNDSPIHMSFSESDGSGKEDGLNFLAIKDFSYSAKKSSNSKSKVNDDNRSDRSLTPYLSHESDEDIPAPKTKPGPKSAKAVIGSRPGPMSSKAGPKSSKVGNTSVKAGPKSSKVVPKPGPKSSKTVAKPGPKSSKTAPKIGPKSWKRSVSIDVDSDSDSMPRSRRSAAKGVNYDNDFERITTSYSSFKPSSKSKKTAPKGRSGTTKWEMDSAIASIISPNDSYSVNDYSKPTFEETADLVWKSFNGELVQIDYNFYDNSILNSCGNESLELKFTPDYIVKPYLVRYEDNEDYWAEVRAEVEEELTGGPRRARKGGQRSKGALKDFYTLPHLNANETLSHEKAEKVRPKSETSAKKVKTNSCNEFARLMTDASDFLDKPLGKRGAQTKAKAKVTKSAPVAKTPPAPKRSSSATKSSSRSKTSAKSSARNIREKRFPRGVTSSTLFTTTDIGVDINLPFYDSDIRVVTDLIGAKKKSYLKSLCEKFELEIDKLPKHYVQRYQNHNISPFLFQNIYYNDYSGYLSDEESEFTQDVIITMKNIIENVVSVSQTIDSVVKGVENQLEPKPMLDTQEEDFFEETAAADDQNDWDYGHYESYEDQEVVGVAAHEEDIGVPVNSDEEESYVMTEEHPLLETEHHLENGNVIKADDPLSELVMKTFGANEDNEEVIDNREGQQNEHQLDNENQNGGQESDNEEEQQSEHNEEEISPDEPEEAQHYDESDLQYPHSAQSNQYSNNNEYIEQNSVQYQSNQYEEESESESTSSSASNQLIEPNEALNLSDVEAMPAVPMVPNSEPFKMETTFGTEMFAYGVNAAQPQPQPHPMSYHQNPLQNPIVPTLIPQNIHHFSPNVYPTQHNWTQNIQMSQMPTNPSMQYNMSLNVEPQQQTPQPDNEFDVSNYSYMSYNPYNPNIPQFDGIFDDDSFHSEGNQFNMKCNSDDNIEQLSQGSRTEEMSTTVAKKPIADMVSEALLGRKVCDTTRERYGYCINGVVVKIPKSLPEVLLRQLGREVVPLDRLRPTHNHISGQRFTHEDCKTFMKTRLIGSAKLQYLESLCNKNIRICLNRLNLTENELHLKYINTNTSFTTVSSLFNSNQLFDNKVFVNQNESKLTAQTKSNASDSLKLDLTVPVPTSGADDILEIPESPLNDISNNDNCNEIYSFYSDHTLSSPNLSQSTIKSHKCDQSFDDIPSEHSTRDQHSTPLNNKKCKSFSQTLNDSTNFEFDFDLSSDSPKTSKLSRSLSQNCKSNESNAINNKHFYRNDSVIEGPTPDNTHDFELSSASAIDSPNDPVCDYEYQYLTTMSVEIHVSTRAQLNPDPQTDAIEVIFYSISYDRPTTDASQPKYITGLIAVEPELESFECNDSFNAIRTSRKRTSLSVGADRPLKVEFANDEIVLLMKFVEVVKHFDPDVITGYKIDTQSWGYVLERANVLNMSIMTPLSRINDDRFSRNCEGSTDVKCQLCGRITLNLWSIIRHEVTLKQYHYENVHFHVLHQRIPSLTFAKLTQLYANPLNHYNRRRVVDYYLTRTVGSLRLLDKLDFIPKTSELARLFGIQFQEVFNRGTQFRVESIMLRTAKPFKYMPMSPSPQQVSAQRAPEILPLILEPESKYYTDPIAVLDFQSLYPSMMIAYNYCYSTCLGKVDQLISENNFVDFGCADLEVNKQLLYKYRNDIHISPNGVVFLKPNVRKGILPKMLSEILETRVMVKNAMKANNKKPNPSKVLHRKLDARQLGLKMIANVTYGYTNANFSGRMPCVDIADSIVAKGRETLERAINLVNSRPEWGGKVVYGDTDSLFVLFPGLTKDEAFKRGQEMAEAVTAINPKPVKLKFEKVYLPSVLETKKRYVGFSYETPEQTSPKFDAKGIETVRRDSCPAVSKMLEKSLRILFETNDINGVKQYLFRQFQKILNGRVSILNDFVLAREYRGADSYSDKSHVPSMEIAKRRLATDPRSEPKVRERVPYVVISGAPNEPLFKLIKEPMDLINNPALRLNSQYYIERLIIPALNRVFHLMGQDVNVWYREMPKRIHYNRYQYLLGQQSKPTARQTIPQFFNTTQCVVCDSNSKGKDFCEDCQITPHESIVSVSDQIRDIQRKYNAVLNVCRNCSGCADTDIQCQSIGCPNLFRFHQSRLDLMNAKYLNNVLQKYF